MYDIDESLGEGYARVNHYKRPQEREAERRPFARELIEEPYAREEIDRPYARDEIEHPYLGERVDHIEPEVSISPNIGRRRIVQSTYTSHDFSFPIVEDDSHREEARGRSSLIRKDLLDGSEPDNGPFKDCGCGCKGRKKAMQMASYD